MSCKGKNKNKYDMMMQVNMYDCNINSMNMMMNELGEGPPTVKLYEIGVLDLTNNETFNIRIDDSGQEVKLVLTKEKTNTMWQLRGTFGNNQLVAIGTPGETEFWTVINEAPSVGFRPPRNMGNFTQFFALTVIEDNQAIIQRTDQAIGEGPKFIGVNTSPIKEGDLIYSEGGPTMFIFNEIKP